MAQAMGTWFQRLLQRIVQSPGANIIGRRLRRHVISDHVIHFRHVVRAVHNHVIHRHALHRLIFVSARGIFRIRQRLREATFSALHARAECSGKHVAHTTHSE
jgi:hypothetical protein